MKTALTILIAGAAVAGIVYLLKDNEDVKDALAGAKDKASGTWDKLKGSFYDAKAAAENRVSELA
ncbi:MAG: hypothetical protein ACTHMD_04295 [Flavisolibacter sp.]